MDPAILKSCNTAEEFVKTLIVWHVTHVFVVPGAQIDPLIKALAASPNITTIVANHELTAGYMADGYARACGRIGVAMSIGGPGSANLIGAAVSAFADQSPVLFVTGGSPLQQQVPSSFQNTSPTGSNDAEIFRAAIGHTEHCDSAADLTPILARLQWTLQQCKPAHLLFPLDVQAMPAARDSRVILNAPNGTLPRVPDIPPDLLSHGRTALFATADALDCSTEILATLCEFQLPLITDLATRGLLREDDLHAAGHHGFLADPRATALLDQTSSHGAAQLVMVGSNQTRFNQLRALGVALVMIEPHALAQWLKQSSQRPTAATVADRTAWLKRLATLKRPQAPVAPVSDATGLSELVSLLNRELPENAMVALDAGQIRRVAVVGLTIRLPRSLFMADGMAPMGWSMGAAIGIKLAQPSRPLVVLLGDGSMRMHGVELASAQRYRLPILYLVLDNCAYGSVLTRMTGNDETAMAKLPPVDWCGFASAFGLQASQVTDLSQLQQALREIAHLDAPSVLVLRVFPIDPFAKALQAELNASGAPN